ncbi:MAG TPA: lytic transglycosylase domain-containing protein [bacterium]|nr:lytic transglycosylase domain-containing protein [bacterium]
MVRFYDHYSSTTTVETALQQGRRYLPTITRIFRRRGLPLELAYLPMLESKFENRADSGHARGLWQFTENTAGHVGLAVGAFADERLNWYKATLAAADYLDELGQKFNYNWALALAAYNGGPGYIERAIADQHTWNFFDLRLRRETAEYVPRFIAMVQVAKEKYPHLLMAGR